MNDMKLSEVFFYLGVMTLIISVSFLILDSTRVKEPHTPSSTVFLDTHVHNGTTYLTFATENGLQVVNYSKDSLDMEYTKRFGQIEH